MNVKFTSTALDYSGFGSAARNEIAALYMAGTNVLTEIIHQVPETVDLGLIGEIADRLQGKRLKYKVKIIRLTPDLFPRHLEKDVYTIGRVVHETDKLPPTWVSACNQLDEIWATSNERAKMLKDSGVTKPIFAFPEPLDVTMAEDDVKPFQISHPNDFCFYSIFQWIERKNPKALLTAYWKAFEGNDKVVLLLKTYRVFYQNNEFDLIKEEIATWKKEIGQSHYPKVLLIKRLMTDNEVLKLHQMGDCYVSTSSAEGWNRPIAEAMLMDKPVISPSNGGITDYLDQSLYYHIPSYLKEVTPQNHIPWYTSDQKWKTIDIDKLSESMLEVFNNHEVAKEKSKSAKKFIQDNFNFLTVGQSMKSRLEQI